MGVLGQKGLLDVGLLERHREYYMGEGGGFPRVWAVVSLTSPKLHVVCPNTKGVVQHSINQLVVGWMQIRMNE